MSICTDDFTGTDGTTLNGRTTTTGSKTWAVTTGGLEINSNKCYCPTGGTAVLDSGVADVTVQVTLGNISTNLILLRCNSTASQQVMAYIEGTRARLFDEAFTQIGSTYTGTFSFGDVIEFDASGTSLTLKQNGVTRITATSSTHQTNTYVGLRGSGSETFDDFSASVFAAASPTVAFTTADPTSVTLTYTAGTGGTGSPSPQWQAATTPDGTFSNLTNGSGVSGATSTVLVDGSATISGGSRRWYKVVESWSGSGGPFTSKAVGARRGKARGKIYVIGDSVAAGGTGGVDSPYVSWPTYAAFVLGIRAASVTNNAVGGLATFSYYDSTGAGATARLNSDVSAAVAAGVDAFVIAGLGINDAYGSVAAATYKANLDGIAATALAAGLPLVICDYPTCVTDNDTPAAVTLLQSYLAQIDAWANGTTKKVGDTLCFDHFLCHVDQLQLQSAGVYVHPNATGTQNLGLLRAVGLARAYGELGSTQAVFVPTTQLQRAAGGGTCVGY